MLRRHVTFSYGLPPLSVFLFLLLPTFVCLRLVGLERGFKMSLINQVANSSLPRTNSRPDIEGKFPPTWNQSQRLGI